jgi:hypothetical protein
MKKWYNIVAILMTMVIIVGIIATGCAKTTPPQATGPTTINIGLPVALSGSAAIPMAASSLPDTGAGTSPLYQL